MPVSKHRKKGQKKAVKRPGQDRAPMLPPEPGWVAHERLIRARIGEMVGFAALSVFDRDLAEVMAESVMEEALSIESKETGVKPVIGSRQAVIEQFCGMSDLSAGEDEADLPQAKDFSREAAMVLLARFAACGVVRVNGDEITLAFPIDEDSLRAPSLTSAQPTEG